MFVCVRVYRNGHSCFTIRDEEGMKSWLEYNKQWRFGLALFVNGECQANGYYSDEEIPKLTQLVREAKLPENASVNKGKRIKRDGEWVVVYGDD